MSDLFTCSTPTTLAVNRVLEEQTSKRPAGHRGPGRLRCRPPALGRQRRRRRSEGSRTPWCPRNCSSPMATTASRRRSNFMRECEARGGKPRGGESFDKRMIACFNSADQGTTILPTHRVVRDLARVRFGALSSRCGGLLSRSRPMRSPRSFGGDKRAGRQDHVFGFYPGRPAQALPAPPQGGRARRSADACAWRGLSAPGCEHPPHAAARPAPGDRREEAG